MYSAIMTIQLSLHEAVTAKSPKQLTFESYSHSFSHSQFLYSPNLGDISEDHGERYDQNISILKSRCRDV